jgi:hypothetical protein
VTIAGLTGQRFWRHAMNTVASTEPPTPRTCGSPRTRSSRISQTAESSAFPSPGPGAYLN